jgi:hypothetical protein
LLPDYPDIKVQLFDNLTQALWGLVDNNAPLAARIKNYRQVEGDKFSYETIDGQLEVKEFKQIKLEAALPAGLTSSETAELAERKLSELAQKLAQQSEGLLFSTIEQAAQTSGNVVDARGMPLDPSKYWDQIERMPIDFDSAGKAELPTIIVHPDVFAELRRKILESENDPKEQKRRREVLAKKREEWRDREGNRKLVG